MRFVCWAQSEPSAQTVVDAGNMEAARYALAATLQIPPEQVEARVFIPGDERLLQE